MGTSHIECRVEHHDRQRCVEIPQLLVDTGEAGDPQLLGARSLEGLNLRVDAQRKKLVAAGPIPAAQASHQ